MTVLQVRVVVGVADVFIQSVICLLRLPEQEQPAIYMLHLQNSS